MILFWVYFVGHYFQYYVGKILFLFFPSRAFFRAGRRKANKEKTRCFLKRKPAWVRKEIIRLKAWMPEAGCRTIANVFNRRYKAAKGESVSKTFVNNTIRENMYEIQLERKKIKHAKPKPVPKNLIWAMDLTGKTSSNGEGFNLLGILEHGTRACLFLEAVPNKSSGQLLTALISSIIKHGKPKIIRTDNEPVFTSTLFRSCLFLLRIRHQTIDPFCPWQNGRIERFFGTLKERLNQWEIDSMRQLNVALGQFRFWYNCVRPHQNLNGKTPGEMWNGKDVYSNKAEGELWFETWDGLFTGYYYIL